MQRVSRLKYLILATIACVILFCIAAFSVSLALWSGSDETTAEVSGESGLFYVEYPLYKTREEVVPPALNSGTYYLQVTPANNTNNISDYYAMTENNEAEKKLTGVLLHVGDTLAVYNGATPKDINNNSQQDRSDWLTLDGGKYTIETEGLYDFYYVFAENARYFWINRTDYVAPNPSDYEYSFTVKFSDIDEEKTIHYKLNGFTEPCAYIWSENGGTKYYYNANWTTDNNTGDSIGGGNPKAMADAGTTAVKVGEFAETKIIFNNGTDWDDKNKSDDLMLCDYAAQKDNYVTIGKSPTIDSGGTPPTLSGPTTWDGESVAAKKMGEQTVREVNAKITKNDSGQFVYNNYICVSRINGDGADDNSIAYLEFSVSDCSINPYNVVVESVTLTRRNTKADGTPLSGNVDTAPRIYNYDSNEMRLGPDPSHTKPDPDGSEGRYAIFAHGKKHDVSEGLEGEDEYSHMQNHYDDGTYVVLFFGDGIQQYFALDIEIVLRVADDVPSKPDNLDFTLTVTASNTNNWQRYEAGYGKPWGLYLGGLINGVWSWDPSRTTEMAGSPAITGDGDVTTIKQTTDQGTVDVSYPNKPIDYSITVNLTAGSLVKPYLLDETGERMQDGSSSTCSTAYFVAKQIIASDGLYEDDDGNPIAYYNLETIGDTHPSDVNIYIPTTGEYTFRLKGSVTPGYTASRSGWYVNLVTGETKKVDDNEEAPSQDDYWYGVAAFNFLVDELYISTADTAAEFTVKFALNGGTGTGDYSDQTVKFGQCATKPTDPTNGALNFGGWYTNEACTGTAYDFNTIVTDNITLYAKWAANMYTVTFDAKGGSFDEDVNNEVTVAEGTTVSKIQPDPTYAGYIFKDWYDNEEYDGDPYDFDTAVTGDFTLYAKWVESVTITFDKGDGTTSNTTIEKGSTVTEWPEIASTGYHHFDGWFTDAADGTQIDTDTATFDADTTVYARFTDKVRIVIDASELYNVNSDNTYHIHAWNSDDQTLTGAWTERKQLTHMGNGQFYYDFDSVPSGFIVTLDSNDTMIELGRFAPNSVTGLALGAAKSFTMNVASLTFDSQLYNQIGLVFNDGVIVLDASAWSADDRPNQIYMWKGIGGDITAKWSGDTIKYGEFRKYNVGLSDVYGIILVKNGSGVTGDITPGNTTDGVAYPSLDNGKIYIIKEHTLTAKTTVTVMFDSDGGSAVDAQTVWKDGHVVKPTDPTREDDMVFDGWYNGSAAWDFDNDTVSGDITLTAHWTKWFTVMFDANGGSWNDETPHTQAVKLGATVARIAGPDNAPDGKIFADWASQDGEPFNFNTPITDDITLYAVWKNSSEVTKYTVTFHSEGADVSTQEVVEGLTATNPTPTRAGWTLAGWYTDEACSWYAEYDFSTTVVDNIDLYARWMPATIQSNSYYLTGDNMWGNFQLKHYFGPISGFAGGYIKVQIPDGAFSGKYFRIVKTDGSGSVAWTDDYGYDQIDNGKTLCGNPDSNNISISAGTYIIVFKSNLRIDIYDVNNISRVNVEFKLDDDTTYQTHSVVSGCPVTPWPSEPEREGLRFDGWYIGNTQVSEDTVFSADTTVTAKWVQQFTVTFDANGGSWNDESTPHTQAVDAGGIATEIDPPENAPEGKMFSHWSESETGTAFTGWNSINSNIILYAVWEDKPADTYTITFDVNIENGGTGTNKVYRDKSSGASVAIPTAPTPSNVLYDFVGWYDSETGDPLDLALTTLTVGNSDKTYVAHYEVARYRIELDVSAWGGDTFTYHIYSSYTASGATQEPTGAMGSRAVLTKSSTGKYYIDIADTEVKNIVFTQDESGTRNEISRYVISSVSGLQLGQTKSYTATLDDITVENYNRIVITYSGGNKGYLFVNGAVGVNYWDAVESISNAPVSITSVTSLTAGQYGGVNLQFTGTAIAGNWSNQTGGLWWTYSAGSIRRYSVTGGSNTYNLVTFNLSTSNATPSKTYK